METNEVMEKFAETIDGLKGSVADLTAKVDEQKEFDLDAALEKALRDKFEAPEPMPAEQQKKRAKGYGFYQARKEVAAGNVAPVPNWDLDTELKFADFVVAIKDNDQNAIRKAYGDAPYTETTGYGGYLVPEEFRAELIRLSYLRSWAMQHCRILPMSTDNMVIPTLSSGYTAAWGSINTQKTDTRVTFGQVSLTAEKLIGVSLVPNELLGDSALPVASIIANEFAESFANKIDEEVITGDSTDSGNHKFNGWQNASSVNEVQPSAGDDTPTAAELISEANLLSMVGQLDDRELMGARWVMHPTAWAVVRAIEDGSSSKIVRLNENYKYDLLGFPVDLSNNAPSVSALTNDESYVFFGNPQHIIIGDRMQFTMASSDGNRFSYDQTAFRATQRLAIAVAIPSALVRLAAPSTA